jgi:hypothetical protein
MPGSVRGLMDLGDQVDLAGQGGGVEVEAELA